MATTGKVNTIIRLRINSDGNGVRSVVFLQNCPLACLWCCNPETRYGNNYKEITTDQLYELINRDLVYFEATNGGITFSGGEPLLQADFIIEFLEKYGNRFLTNIETSLSSSRETIERFIPHIDEWYIDFKIYDEQSHLQYTGVSGNTIKENIVFLTKKISTDKIILTYPIIPGINDSMDNVDQMIAFMQSNILYQVELHPYRKNREKKNEKLGLEYQIIDKIDPITIQRIKKQFQHAGITIISRDTHIEKRKCNTLKAIRKEYCDSNNIPVDITECTYKGRCVGTCPKCEDELDIINEWRLENNA